jgi:hypothetical protein
MEFLAVLSGPCQGKSGHLDFWGKVSLFRLFQPENYGESGLSSELHLRQYSWRLHRCWLAGSLDENYG